MAQLDFARSTPATPAPGYGAFGIKASPNGGAVWIDENGVSKGFSPTGVYDVTDYGVKGDDSTDNQAALNTLYGLLPSNSTMYFPAGTYRLSAELNINADKAIRFLGAGKTRSVLKTTSNTANIFHVSPTNAWYNTFDDLGFTASGTPTAGAAVFIDTSVASIGADVRRCRFTNLFKGIHYNGAQAGNVSVLDSLDIASPVANGVGIKIDGSTINLVISNSTINMAPGTSAPAGTKGIELNQCGAVQIVGCDLIGGVNTLHVNATATVSALLVTNCFFDQAGGSTVKFSGTAAISRVRFEACEMTCSGTMSNVSAIEIAGTGTGTGIPTGIDFVNCSIYNNGATGTTNGILATGVKDFSVQACRISGAFTNGINVTPYNTAGFTKFNISGCVIGPTMNFSAPATGILLNVGSVTYGSFTLADNDLTGCTTAPLTDNSAASAAGQQKTIIGNAGLLVGSASLSTEVTAIAAVDTLLIKIPVPARALRIGSSFKVTIRGNQVGATSASIAGRLKYGTAGTTGDTQISTDLTTALSGGAAGTPWELEWIVTVKLGGASGTFNVAGVARIFPTATTLNVVKLQATSAAFDMTVDKFIDVTVIGAGTTPSHTAWAATIEVIQQ